MKTFWAISWLILFGLKLKREISELMDIIHQTDIVNIYTIFHLNTKEYTFYSDAYESFFGIEKKS